MEYTKRRTRDLKNNNTKTAKLQQINKTYKKEEEKKKRKTKTNNTHMNFDVKVNLTISPVLRKQK